MTSAAQIRWAALICIVAAPALATPAFAIREGVTCSACHVNPSGGGMRNEYGHAFAATALPTTYPRQLGLPQFEIGDIFAFGADARTAYLYQWSAKAKDAALGTIFEMQADLYVSATPFNGLTLYYDQGAYGSFEAMAMYRVDFGRSASAYLKAGRFMPSYGVRLPNHNVFTRQDLGFGAGDKDQGAELGFNLGPLLVQAAVLNGAGAEALLDDNINKAVTGRVELGLNSGPLHVNLGGSIYYNKSGTQTTVRDVVVDTTATQLQGAVHLSAALGRFAYLGEADLTKNTPSVANTKGSLEYGFRSYQELDIRLFRGLDLNLAYEFREPNLLAMSGTAQRMTLGVEFYPIPYCEVKLMYRRSFGKGPDEEGQDGNNEFVAMLHVFL